jgi:hypothetical protein
MSVKHMQHQQSVAHTPDLAEWCNFAWLCEHEVVAILPCLYQFWPLPFKPLLLLLLLL